MALKPSGTAARHRTDALRAAILSGELADAGRLLPERTLAERLSVSRTRLRAVLAEMAQEGLIFRRHGQGTFLQPPPAQGAERLSVLARRASPRDLMEVRRTLEPPLAALAAERATSADKARLLRLMEETLQAQDLASYERADDIFHYKIVEMAGNAVFLTVFEEIRSLRQAGEWTRSRQQALGTHEIARLSQQHTAIADAICAGAPEAAKAAMQEHLAEVGQLLDGRQDG